MEKFPGMNVQVNTTLLLSSKSTIHQKESNNETTTQFNDATQTALKNILLIKLQ